MLPCIQRTKVCRQIKCMALTKPKYTILGQIACWTNSTSHEWILIKRRMRQDEWSQPGKKVSRTLVIRKIEYKQPKARDTRRTRTNETEIKMLNCRYGLTCAEQSVKLTDYEFSRRNSSMKTLTRFVLSSTVQHVSLFRRRFFFFCRWDEGHSVTNAALPPPPVVVFQLNKPAFDFGCANDTVCKLVTHVGLIPFNFGFQIEKRVIGPYGIETDLKHEVPVARWLWPTAAADIQFLVHK